MDNKIKLSLLFIGALLLGVILWGGVVFAGDPDSSDPPNAASSYSLEDLFQRLAAGTAGSSSTFTEPSSGPGSGTMHTINEIMAVAPLVNNSDGAAPSDVLSGKTFWGLRDDAWALQTGTGSATQSASPSSSAVPKTGQISCYDGAGGVISCQDTGQDGEYELGTDFASMPVDGIKGAYLAPSWTGERFTVSNGTVRDNLTSLIWLQQADCFAASTWTVALTAANTLNSGECGLSDGSIEGDWRLPNPHELHSLVDLGQTNPSLPPGHPFTNVIYLTAYYWTSTTYETFPGSAWVILFQNGNVTSISKKNALAVTVWPVRGGQ